MSPIWYMCVYKPVHELLQHVPELDRVLAERIVERVKELDA